MTEQSMKLQLEWQRPAKVPPLSEARRKLQVELVTRIKPGVIDVWTSEIPGQAMPMLTKQVVAGVRRGVLELTRPPTSENYIAHIWYLANALPQYWEPPVSPSPPPETWPANQVQAYRWAAASIGLAVRNELELLHADYNTDDDRMPILNRRIRNAAYSVLLDYPGHAWRLTEIPRAILEAAAMKVPGVTVPPVAG